MLPSAWDARHIGWPQRDEQASQIFVMTDAACQTPLEVFVCADLMLCGHSLLPFSKSLCH